jgi:hypothetical protein
MKFVPWLKTYNIIFYYNFFEFGKVGFSLDQVQMVLIFLNFDLIKNWAYLSLPPHTTDKRGPPDGLPPLPAPCRLCPSVMPGPPPPSIPPPGHDMTL